MSPIFPFGFPTQPARGVAPPAKREHEVGVVIADREIRGWTDYQIDVGVLEAADRFMMTLPFDRRAWDYVRADARVKITIDGTSVLDGFLDSRRSSSRDGTIQIAGRDKVGRLVQESAQAVTYQGKLLSQLVAEIAAPWFTRVVFSNARNRRVMRTRHGKKSAKLAADSGRVWLDSKVGTHTNPGEMRWAIIEELCQQAGYMCWSSGDGTELVIGQPDYRQAVQYRFYQAPLGAGPITQATTPGLLDLSVEDSTADRYSRVLVLGSGRGTNANYGPPVASRSGEAKNNPATVNGEGLDFSAPKRLILADRDDVKSRADAEAVARREMARRDMDAHVLSASCATHGQQETQSGGRVLFVPDTMAYAEDPDRGVRGAFWVAACSYRSSRNGETTDLSLLPSGTEIVP